MDLRNARAVILTANLYQELEFWYPFLRLREAGTRVTVAAAKAGELYGSKLGVPVVSDVAVADVEPGDFDVLIIPGGFAPEALRLSEDVLDLVRKTNEQGKLIAAICHAPWVLVSAGIADGRTLTCVRGIRDDVRNGGAELLDQPVVRDGNVITSRPPNDLDAFGAEIVKALQALPASDGDAGSPRELPASSASADYAGAVAIRTAARLQADQDRVPASGLDAPYEQLRHAALHARGEAFPLGLGVLASLAPAAAARPAPAGVCSAAAGRPGRRVSALASPRPALPVSATTTTTNTRRRSTHARRHRDLQGDRPAPVPADAAVCRQSSIKQVIHKAPSR
jgi:protease I